MSIVKMHKEKPMVEQTDGIVTGLVPALQMESEEPYISWSGAPFPRKLYLQTVAFAKWCAEEYGGEVQGRLYYSEARKKWRVVIMPQYTSRSLASKEIADHKDRGIALRIVEGGDWVQNGTWHSHVFAGAGQSSIDLADELKQPGFHYTVGSLSEQRPTFHCRYSFRGLMYPADADEFIKKPLALMSRCKSFPDKWKDMLFEDKTAHNHEFWGMDKGADVGNRLGGCITANGCSYTKEEWLRHIGTKAYADRLKHEYNKIEMEDEQETFGFYGQGVETAAVDAEHLENFLSDTYMADGGTMRMLSFLLNEITGEPDIPKALGDLDSSINMYYERYGDASFQSDFL